MTALTLSRLAADQADRELVKRPSVAIEGEASPVIIQELKYAAQLLMRADAAIAKEFAVLRAGGVDIAWIITQALSAQLVTYAVDLQLLAVQCEERAA
ncbi:hypothetical protein [Duganella vulcania]|uniref:Uncharacterized protein n=1 Tax=Duganella vulcania TaxID=2692166 RepID=A0A845GSB2_9BURK|nr:hypothetical protein [Duganella vulcania]MYM96252.1 hypothetical protein [Duganella vulcania]